MMPTIRRIVADGRILGQMFDVLKTGGGISGTFGVVELPSLTGNIAWNVSYLANGVRLEVVPSLPGDYDHNNVVDAADYVVWRKTDRTPTGYSAWRSHFGQTAGSGVAVGANVGVPEPTTLVMLIAAVAGWCLRRVRAA
jgi:hypothetical protein